MQLPVIQGLWTVDNARVMDKTTRRQGDSIPAYDHPPRQYMGLWRRVDLPRQAVQKGVVERRDAGPWLKRMLSQDLNPVISRTPRAYHAPRVLVLDKPTGDLGSLQKKHSVQPANIFVRTAKNRIRISTHIVEKSETWPQPTRDIPLAEEKRMMFRARDTSQAILSLDSYSVSGKPGHTLESRTVSFQWRWLSVVIATDTRCRFGPSHQSS